MGFSVTTESNDILNIIFEAASDGILVAETESKKFLTANKVCCTMLGYTVDELRKLDLTAIHPKEDLPNVLKQFERQYKREIIVADNIPIKRKDGTVFYTDISSGKMYYEGKDYLVGIFRDVTEKIRTDKELLRVKKLESVGALAGGIAHDFNNILGAIIGNIELAQMYTDSTSKACGLLIEAQKASVRAKDLTQQLLTFAKGGEPVTHSTSIDEIIIDSADFVLHGSCVKGDYNFPEDLWDVEVDIGQISQVIQNIALNARHAMPVGGTISVCCENMDNIKNQHPLLTNGKFIKLTIADTGSGIPEKYIDRIFDPYFSTKQEGSGLGLAICHSVINKHGGTITVSSKTGKGTTFTIFLPASQKAAQIDIIPEKANFASARKATVLFLDDDSMMRTMVKHMLVRGGHKVLLSKTGEEAIELYRKHHNNGQTIDIVIMDLTIPGGMGGKDALYELLKINREVKAIVVSGYSNDPVIAHCEEYGFVASIVKPFLMNELNDVVNKVLQKNTKEHITKI